MSFEVDAEAYGRFMGRYSEPLSVPFTDATLGPDAGLREMARVTRTGRCVRDRPGPGAPCGAA